MGKFTDTMIITDIDGTFMTRSKGVPENNTCAVKDFCAQGGLFTFATGRMHLNLLSAIPNAPELANTPGIMANGTYLYDFTNNQTVAEDPMNPEITLSAMKFTYKFFPDVGIRLTTKSGFLTNALEGLIKKDLVRSHLAGCISVSPIEEWDCRDCYKIVFRAPSDRLDEFRAALESEYGDVFEYSKSASDFFELQNKGATKASMLAKVRENYESETGRKLKIYACGDYENDIEMLSEADVAVCPSNAIEEVKKICDMCLCSCDEGLIGALYEIINR